MFQTDANHQARGLQQAKIETLATNEAGLHFVLYRELRVLRGGSCRNGI
jgi:hypothetical protein